MNAVLRRLPPDRYRLALAVIFSLALCLRLEYVTTAVVFGPIRADAAQYYACAWNLVHHGIYSMTTPGSVTPVPDSFRDPAFPALIAVWLRLAPDNDAWYSGLLVTQSLLSALTVLFTMLLAQLCLPLPGVIATGLIAAVWPHNIIQSSFILSETLTGFLLTAGMWILVRAVAPRTFILSGIAFGAAGLSNAVFAPFPVVLALVLYCGRQLPKNCALIFLTSALSLPMAWTARNLSLPVSPDNSSGGRAIVNLVQGSHPEYLKSYREARVRQDPAAIEILARVSAEQEIALQSPLKGATAILSRFADSPWLYLKWYLVGKPTMLWGWQLPTGQGDLYQYPTLHSPFTDRPAWIFLISIAKASDYWWALLMLGAILMVATRTTIENVSASTAPPQSMLVLMGAISLVAYTTTIYSIMQAEPRYVIAVRGFEFILAILMLHELILAANHLRSRTRPASVVRRRDRTTP